jgi:hypothetical protein
VPLQPVAAEPVNVGEYVPRLDDLTVLAVLASALAPVPTEAAIAPAKTTTSAAVRDDSDRKSLLDLISAPFQ